MYAQGPHLQCETGCLNFTLGFPSTNVYHALSSVNAHRNFLCAKFFQRLTDELRLFHRDCSKNYAMYAQVQYTLYHTDGADSTPELNAPLKRFHGFQNRAKRGLVCRIVVFKRAI